MSREATAAAPAPSHHAADDERTFVEHVLRAESRAVLDLINHLTPDFTRAVDLVVACAAGGGTVLVTGLGKSGLIGAKIAATLASLGIPSHFVHPTEAAHGDLGRFRPSDLCLALSYSGETEEVVALAAILRQDGLPVVSISAGRPGSRLARLSSAALAIGPVEDAAVFSPAPTASSTAMLALADALCLAAARRRNDTHSDFARRHPGGTLGELCRPVVDVLRFRVGHNLVPVPDGATVAEALRAGETTQRRPGALLLVDAATGVLTGIFTDADLRRLVLRDPAQLARPVRELMTRSPGALPDTALVRDAVHMVREHRRDEIPVVDAAGRPVGLLDVQDLVAMRVVSA